MANVQFGNNFFDYEKLNAYTGYPSIKTYHVLADDKTLLPELHSNMKFGNEPVRIVEKIYGTNGRIVFVTDSDGIISDFMIGTREALLMAKRADLIVPPITSPIIRTIDVLDDYADQLMGMDIGVSNKLFVLYAEIYGGKQPRAKQYTTTKKTGVRFFDCFCVDVDDALCFMENNSKKEIEKWREQNNQPFLPFLDLALLLKKIGDRGELNFEKAPSLGTILGPDIPVSLEDTYKWMKTYKHSMCTLDASAEGKSEGIILRTENRSFIRKLRFGDYKRTRAKGIF